MTDMATTNMISIKSLLENDDVKSVVFNYLSVGDILNIAVSNKACLNHVEDYYKQEINMVRSKYRPDPQWDAAILYAINHAAVIYDGVVPAAYDSVDVAPSRLVYYFGKRVPVRLEDIPSCNNRPYRPKLATCIPSDDDRSLIVTIDSYKRPGPVPGPGRYSHSSCIRIWNTNSEGQRLECLSYQEFGYDCFIFPETSQLFFLKGRDKVAFFQYSPFRHEQEANHFYVWSLDCKTGTLSACKMLPLPPGVKKITIAEDNGAVYTSCFTSRLIFREGRYYETRLGWELLEIYSSIYEFNDDDDDDPRPNDLPNDRLIKDFLASDLITVWGEHVLVLNTEFDNRFHVFRRDNKRSVLCVDGVSSRGGMDEKTILHVEGSYVFVTGHFWGLRGIHRLTLTCHNDQVVIQDHIPLVRIPIQDHIPLRDLVRTNQSFEENGPCHGIQNGELYLSWTKDYHQKSIRTFNIQSGEMTRSIYVPHNVCLGTGHGSVLLKDELLCFWFWEVEERPKLSRYIC